VTEVVANRITANDTPLETGRKVKEAFNLHLCLSGIGMGFNFQKKDIPAGHKKHLWKRWLWYCA